MNDEVVYAQLLQNFKADHDRDDEKIALLTEAGDTKSAHRLAHTLKSTAALIGAARLRQAAAAVETEFAEGDPKRVPELLENLRAEFSDLRAALRNIKTGDTETAYAPQASAREAREIDKQAAVDLIERLAPLLSAGNAKCLDMTDEIRKTLMPLGRQTEELVEQMEDFSFAAALDALKTIKTTILGGL
jgi:HPt (histidine-containing phosphotransfer) domain-containing protein